MAIFKCKMCGGDLEIANGATVCECEYCGTKQTLPNTNDEKITNLFNRANQLRMVNRFDEAKKVYETILMEDNSNAEAHWGVVLCKFGIEYVYDENTDKKIPTCHRAVASSIFSDIDYIETIKNSDDYSKSVYEQEAKSINEIQRGILEQVADAEQYDVFICYKETDEATGDRTEDSVIAQDLYFELEKRGYKTFFARKTLEGKLGVEYEPVIFSALSSSKVMVVLGTKPEYFESVWLKNEWGRFLDFTKDSGKLLIPAFRGFSPYSLPTEFSSLQSLDMGKIGFMQDLIDAIDKISKSNDATNISNSDYTTVNNVSTVEPLVERSYMFLEDKEWDKAMEYCERALDMDPKNAEAYFCKFLAVNRCCSYDMLIKSVSKRNIQINQTNDYQKAKKFADEKLKQKIDAYEGAMYESAYQLGIKYMNEKKYDYAIEKLNTVASYKDASQLIASCKDCNSQIKAVETKIEAENRQLEQLKSQHSSTNKSITKAQDKLLSTINVQRKKIYELIIISVLSLVSLIVFFAGMNSMSPSESENLTGTDVFLMLDMLVWGCSYFAFCVLWIMFKIKVLKAGFKDVFLSVLISLLFPYVGNVLAIKESIQCLKGKSILKPAQEKNLKSDVEMMTNNLYSIKEKIDAKQSNIDALKSQLKELKGE